ncbi:MerR family transcriptional regulator [Bordetella trematum]|uniref:MerR family transcriptional regulator n=1 Tax=Bordetella trematum TaxID=123899 RepID=UPI003989AD17
MQLRIGELARRSGLTVRTLHHYHAIGLLVPSARADNGYRLYGRDDIARLHRIQALRRFGLPLADIGAYLDAPDMPLADLVARQIAQLTRQIAQADRLRQRLSQLQAQLLDGIEPELGDWLTTLELMSMYERYFSQQELQRLPMYLRGPASEAPWRALVEAVRALRQAGVPADDARAGEVARRWMAQLQQDTGGDPRLLLKLDRMHAGEPAMQASIGIEPALRDYVLAAFNETRVRLFEPYLTPAERAYLRANYAAHAARWPALVGEVRDAIEAGHGPESPVGLALARRWMALFRGYAGDDPATHARFRQAMAQEPALRESSWLDEAVLGFLRQSAAALTQA